MLGAPNATVTSLAASTQISVVSTTSTPTPSPTSPPACPTDISAGTFEAPSLIIPTSPQDGDNAFGNSTKAYISPVNTTLFTFDDISYTGTCSLLFLFPYASSVDPSAPPYYFSGIEEEEGEHGGLDFAILTGVANTTTTYNATPSAAKVYGKTEIIPGNNYTIATFPCPNGQAVTYSASSVADVELDYYQDSSPSPIGLFIVPCS